MERSIVGLVEPAASQIFITQQSSPVPARASRRVAPVPSSVVLPASLPIPQQISFPLSLDPPASGPASSDMAPTSRSQSRSQQTASPFVVSIASSAVSRTGRHRQTTRKKPDVEEESTESAVSDAAVRRSSRNRKRAPVAPKEGSPSKRGDPPAKRAKRSNLKKPPPSLKKDDVEDSKMPAKGEITASCCICMEEPKPDDLASIKVCDHLFCFDCIDKWSERENTCPLCKVRFREIDRVNKRKKKAGESIKNTKRVKQKDQRSDLAPTAALEGLLASFASSGFPNNRVARLIYSGLGPFTQQRPPTSTRSAGQRAVAAAAAAAAESDAIGGFPWPGDDDDISNITTSSANIYFRGMHNGGRPTTIANLLRGIPLPPVGSVSIPRSSTRGVHPLNLGDLLDFDPPPPVRNYASNSAEQGVGRAANPLVIDDSDDDEEDDVEVVHVSPSTRTAT